MISQRAAYRPSPKPPSTASTTNVARTLNGSVPRCRARPAATPPTHRSSVLRKALGGGPGAARTGVGGDVIRPQSSHSTGGLTMSGDPEHTLVHTLLALVRTRGSPDGAE